MERRKGGLERVREKNDPTELNSIFHEWYIAKVLISFSAEF